MGSDQNRQVRRDRTRSVVAGGFREGGMGGRWLTGMGFYLG